MLVPAGAAITTKQWGGGWGGLVGKSEGVTLIGVARLGAPAKAEDIEAFGVRAIGISGNRWTQIDKGSGQGWNWYRTVRAQAGAKLAFGGYGVGRRGSYLLILVTTPDFFNAHRSDFETWYKSIRLY